MKKLVVAMAIILVAGSAYAQSVKGKTMLGFQGDFGFSSTSGKVPTGYDTGSAASYAIGAKFGYGVTDGSMLMMGVGYAYRALPLTFSYYGASGDLTFKQSYIDIDLEWRILFTYLYLDLGMYYGIRAGDMKYSATGDVASVMGSSGTIKSGNGITLSNDYGLILGIGHLFAINENVAIDLEGKYRMGFAKVYKVDGGSELSNDALLLSLGVNYTF
jgi:opacity protein-like surface antigen